MRTLTVTFGWKTFTLKQGTSVRKLEKRIVTALRTGAGVVKLPLASGGSIDAIVSAGLPVTVDQRKDSQLSTHSAEVAWETEGQLDRDRWEVECVI